MDEPVQLERGMVRYRMVILLLALQLATTPANEIRYDVSVGQEKGSALLQLGENGNRRLDIKSRVSKDLQKSLGVPEINASFIVLSGNTNEGYLLLHDMRTIHEIDLSGTRAESKKRQRFIVEEIKAKPKKTKTTDASEVETMITDTQSGDVIHVWHDPNLGDFSSFYGLLSSLQPHLSGADDILARQKRGLPRRVLLRKKHGPQVTLNVSRAVVSKIKPEIFDSPSGYRRSAPGAITPALLSKQFLHRQLGAP